VTDVADSCEEAYLIALIEEFQHQALAVKGREAAARACNRSEKGDQDTSWDSR
jgi:hypothetical protein